MAAFADLEAAQNRAQELMASGAATVAHGCLLENGTPIVRLLRPLSATGSTEDGMNAAGAWDIIDDDSQT